LLRERARDGVLTLTRHEFLGAMDRLSPPTFKVDEWWRDGAQIDLGGRVVEILHTPGHTPSSVSVWEPSARRLYAGDYLYPGELYAFLPGASLKSYEDTAGRLLARLPQDVRIYAAHMQEPPAVPAAPVMKYADLEALQATLRGRRAGSVASEGVYPERYPVRGPITLATGFPWNLR
jgi:glyoxylase-like metal-dependent hydrolase (beta-lactamase superfamily II)